MSDINELGQQRRSAVRAIKRALKTVDSSVEKLERLLNRILGRRRLIPRLEEFREMGTMIRNIDGELMTLTRVWNTAAELELPPRRRPNLPFPPALPGVPGPGRPPA